MAHAALPALLPTPARWMMMPLLPTPPCVAVLLPTSPPRPSRADADADERWDACKNAIERHGSDKKSATSSSSTSSSSSSSASRASQGEKWVSRASSVERWDAHKKPRPPPQAFLGTDDDDGRRSSTGSNGVELEMRHRLFYAA